MCIHPTNMNFKNFNGEQNHEDSLMEWNIYKWVPHNKMLKCQESKITLTIFGITLYCSLMLYDFFKKYYIIPNLKSKIDCTFCRYARWYGLKDNCGNPNHHRSIKRGCLIQFLIRQLYIRPKVAEIIFYH